MSYDKDIQKQRVLGYVKSSAEIELEYTKKQNFERAIQLALDEINDLEKAFNTFVSQVIHLEVFRDSIEKQLINDMTKAIENLRYMIEKNYTKEETSIMPEEVLRQVKATQQRRMQLLKKVAQRYLSRPKKG